MTTGYQTVNQTNSSKAANLSLKVIPAALLWSHPTEQSLLRWRKEELRSSEGVGGVE